MALHFPLYLNFALSFCTFTLINGARVILTLYALDLRATPFEVGLLAALFFLLPLFLSWPMGKLSDRFGPRGLLMLSALSAAAAMLLPYFIHQLWALFVSAALCGLCLVLANVIQQSLVGLLSKPHELSRNYGNFGMIGAMTFFFGPLLAGLAIDHFGFQLACLGFVTFPVAGLAMLMAWGRLLPGAPPGAAPTAALADLLRNRRFVRMLLVSGLVQSAIDLFLLYMPIYGHEVGLSASAIGSILAAVAVASFIARLSMPALIQWMGEARLLGMCFCAAATGFLLVPVFQNAIALTLVAVVFGLGSGCGVPLTMMLMYTLSASGRAGEALGLRMTAISLMRVAVPPVLGLVGSVFGLIPVFALMAAGMGWGALLSFPRGKM
jgi:MFS family permease